MVQSGIVPQVCFLGTYIDTEEQSHKGDDGQDERFPQVLVHGHDVNCVWYPPVVYDLDPHEGNRNEPLCLNAYYNDLEMTSAEQLGPSLHQRV